MDRERVHVEFSALEPGENWFLCSMHDPAMSRGIWFRMMRKDGSEMSSHWWGPTDTVQDVQVLQICAGREGNDCLATISRDDLDDVAFNALLNCLGIGAAMVEEDGDRLVRLLEARKRGE